RLARELARRHDQAQVDAGRKAWIPPEIHPYGAWLRILWEDWLCSGGSRHGVHLLRPAEERVIWERIVRESSEAVGLARWAPAAEAALEAWTLAGAWRLPIPAGDR